VSQTYARHRPARQRPLPQLQQADHSLPDPRPQLGAPDKDEYLALLGALGGLVGLALASTSENTN
jgi:hypothetical protein